VGAADMGPIMIVGAGPAGLAAAWRLAEAGHGCVLVEAAGAVGGMAGSFEVGGQRVDYGSHRLHPATPPYLLAELRGLLGADLQVRRRNGRIRLLDRWVAFPLRAVDLLRNLPAGFTIGTARDTAARPFTRSEPRNFMEEVSARMGPTVADTFYGPMARKLYGVSPQLLEAEQARRRISAASPVDVARRLVGRGKRASSQFLYPRTGYGAIVERLAEAASSAGVDIRLNTTIAQIDLNQTTLFTPAPAVLAKALSPAVPAEISRAVAAQRTRAMVLTYLVLEVDQYTPFDAHYLPGPETPMSRLSEPKNYRDGPDPAGRTVLCAEIPCWVGDPVWNASPEELGELVTADLMGLGLPPAHPVEVEVRRLGSVYPVYELANAAERAEVRRWSASFDNVMVLGRQGLGVPDNLHHVLRMGWEAAACVNKDGAVDSAMWNAALARFADHVVED
jgi:protoporphyrinogen oxidase